MNKPAYQSDTYYDVVIKNGTFLGWKTTYVGLGRMKFIHPNHGTLNITEHTWEGEWMELCWNDFVDHAIKLEEGRKK